MKYFYSFYAESFRIAFTSILAHKLRAFLTLIGIIIGVASVVLVGAAISGLNTYVIEKVGKMLGANHFMIARFASSGQMSEEELERRNRRNPKLQFADMDWLKEHCQSCSAVGAQVGRGTKFEQDGKTFFGGIIFGVTANMADIEDKTITEGRFIEDVEVDHGSLVTVLGADIKDKFFPDEDPIGKTLKVGGLPMRVVGVEERRGPIFGDLVDKHVYIPITTFARIYGAAAGHADSRQRFCARSVPVDHRGRAHGPAQLSQVGRQRRRRLRLGQHRRVARADRSVHRRNRYGRRADHAHLALRRRQSS